MKVIKFMIMFFFIFTINLNASEYDEYEYTSSKQDNGLTYELTKVDLTNEYLELEGWAYIPDVQHYKNTNDIKITIMSYESGGKKTFYPTQITNKYDLTPIEKYDGIEYCDDNIYNQLPDECAYMYTYVSFNVNIPLDDFVFPHTYEFYIYVEAKDAHIKRYTKLYSPNVEDSVVVGNYKYSFVSDVEDTDLVVNDPDVFVRTSPEKNDNNIYTKNSCNYYWEEDAIYSSSSKTFNHPITWYEMNFNASNEEAYNGCLAKSGDKQTGYIASNFVDFQGYGNSTLIIESVAEFSIDLVAIPTINTQDEVIIEVHIKPTNISHPMNISVELKYGEYVETKEITINNNEVHKMEFIIDPSVYQKDVPIEIELLVNDSNSSDNKVVIKPIYASENIQEINLESNENKITFSAASGLAYSNGENKVYNETITINIEAPIEAIQSELNGFNADFKKFYAGGAFSYDFRYDYKNEYPYKYTKPEEVKPLFVIDEAYIDNPKSTIKYVLEDGIYKLEPVYIDNSNNVSSTPSEDDIYEKGKNVIYTSFDLENGKYDFQVKIDNVGINKVDLVINSYFEVEGILFSHSNDALFYYRTTSPINPMPNYVSSLWDNYNMEVIFDEPGEKEINIYLTSDGKKTVKTWVEEDYKTT